MARTESTYPGALDTFTNQATDFNPGDAVPSSDFEKMMDAIRKVETELGTDPAIGSTDVKTLLAGVTEAEMGQVANMGTTTISAAQWGVLGALVEWTDWTPTLTGGADLSGYTSARYFRLGDICFFNFSAENKNVTTAGVIVVTLPFTLANVSGGYFTPSAVINDGTNWIGQPHVSVHPNTDVLNIYKAVDLTEWVGNETGVTIYLSGFFEIA